MGSEGGGIGGARLWGMEGGVSGGVSWAGQKWKSFMML